MPPRNHDAWICSYCTTILRGHFRSLLAEFGLTPNSKRGLTASEAVFFDTTENQMRISLIWNMIGKSDVMMRRQCVIAIVVAILIYAGPDAPTYAVERTATEQPNILFILADDWSDPMFARSWSRT